LGRTSGEMWFLRDSWLLESWPESLIVSWRNWEAASSTRYKFNCQYPGRPARCVPRHSVRLLPRGNEVTAVSTPARKPFPWSRTKAVWNPDGAAPSGPSLAGGLVFCLVRGHTRRRCFHYIRGLNPFRVGWSGKVKNLHEPSDGPRPALGIWLSTWD